MDSLCAALSVPRATYYRHQIEKEDVMKAPTVSKNSLEQSEKNIILDLLHSERFVDKTAYQVYHTLLDEGVYHGSVRTIYRILESENENRERRVLRNHRDAVKPELISTRPNEVWSWDISVPQKAV